MRERAIHCQQEQETEIQDEGGRRKVKGQNKVKYMYHCTAHTIFGLLW